MHTKKYSLKNNTPYLLKAGNLNTFRTERMKVISYVF